MTALWMDGNARLREVLATSALGSAAQAVASLSVFTDPATVARTGGRSLFRLVRRRNQSDVGAVFPGFDGGLVMHDDNSGPTDAFLWANGLSRSGCRDVQFNHVYARSSRYRDHGDVYTSLANIFVTPAFIAKLTDTDDEVRALLRYRVYELYGYAPVEVPARPDGYEALRWGAFPPPVPDLEAALRHGLRRRKMARAARSAREIGWLFSAFQPDPSL